MLNRKKNKRIPTEVNAGSMADIAFLLLIFFLVATTIATDKGLAMKLPPEIQEQAPSNERNVFKIKINSSNELLIEGEVRYNLEGLKDELEGFILNNGSRQDWSLSPEKAIVSLKTNRGTDYKKFIQVLDEIKGAYFKIYADRVGLTSAEYRGLKRDDLAQKKLYEEGKRGIPMNISIAEPDK